MKSHLVVTCPSFTLAVPRREKLAFNKSELWNCGNGESECERGVRLIRQSIQEPIQI